MRFSFPLTALAACLTLHAADAGLSGPVLGLAGSRSGAVHPILGIPGAALVGDALGLGFAASSAAVSPAQNYVLAIDADTGIARVASIGRNGVTAADLAGAVRRPSRILLSPLGSAAALVTADRVQIFSGLPGSPALLREVAASGFSFAALSDDGDLLVTGNAAGVSLFAGDAAAVQLNFPGAIAAAAFRTGSHDAVFAGSSLYLMSSLGANSAIPEGLALPDSDAAPAAAALTAGRALVAYPDGKLAAVDAASGAVEQATCNCTPSSLEWMGNGTLYRLNDLSRGPLMLVDAGSRLAVWFVPAQRSAE